MGHALVDSNYRRALPTQSSLSQRRTDSASYAVQFLKNRSNRPSIGDSANPQTPGGRRSVKMEPSDNGDDKWHDSRPRVKEEDGIIKKYALLFPDQRPVIFWILS